MTLIETLNCDEQEAIEELQMRMKNALPPTLINDPVVFYRFLRARDFDVDKAELMLRKHITWRKAYQVDSILETFKPMEFVVKYLKGSFVGFDKDGDIVRYSPVGNLDIRDVIKSVKMSDYMKHCIWFSETDMQLLKKENEKTGKNASHVTFIFDLDKLQFANVTNKASTELFLKLTQLNQDNYPERMKALYIINAPAYFTLVYTVVKRIMSGAMIRKIHVFGQKIRSQIEMTTKFELREVTTKFSTKKGEAILKVTRVLDSKFQHSTTNNFSDGNWREALLKNVDADILPAFLGGNRTDPDGNEECFTFMNRGGKIPAKYFLTKEQRTFKDSSNVEKITVSQMSKKEIYVDVKESGSHIEWVFETVSKDIGFGLFFQEAENELEEILPILKFDTSDGTETGSYKCQNAGTYVVVFDNTYSWMNSKEVRYCITVVKS